MFSQLNKKIICSQSLTNVCGLQFCQLSVWNNLNNERNYIKTFTVAVMMFDYVQWCGRVLQNSCFLFLGKQFFYNDGNLFNNYFTLFTWQIYSIYLIYWFVNIYNYDIVMITSWLTKFFYFIWV